MRALRVQWKKMVDVSYTRGVPVRHADGVEGNGRSENLWASVAAAPDAGRQTARINQKRHKGEATGGKGPPEFAEGRAHTAQGGTTAQAAAVAAKRGDGNAPHAECAGVAEVVEEGAEPRRGRAVLPAQEFELSARGGVRGEAGAQVGGRRGGVRLGEVVGERDDAPSSRRCAGAVSGSDVRIFTFGFFFARRGKLGWARSQAGFRWSTGKVGRGGPIGRGPQGSTGRGSV